MTRIYVITGFLGSGKTTFLKNLLAEFSGQKVAVVVNEFGSIGVDGKLLRDLTAAVREIAGGSIFCTCKAYEFENVLHDVLLINPDVLMIEASGLADPSCAGELIGKAENARYMGNICLVDAVRFYKVFQTAKVVRKQISVCDAVLLNKTDLAEKKQIEDTIQLIKDYRPDAAIFETSFGEIKGQWKDALLNPKRAAQSGEMQTYDLTIRKNTVRFAPDFSYESMKKLLKLLCEEAYRVKGFVVLDHIPYYVDCVGSMIDIKEYKHSEESALVVLSSSKMTAMSVLKTAKEMYRDSILSIE